MNKVISFLIDVVIVVGIVFLSVQFMPKVGNFGGVSSGDNIFSGGITMSTTSIPNYPATNLILARNVNRQYAKICNETVSTLRLQLSSSVNPNQEIGIPLYASSSPFNCYEIDSNNLYIGALYGLASVTSTVSITEK